MIGLLPAAGKAERILGLPKFLLPIPIAPYETFLLDHHIGRLTDICDSIWVGASEGNYPIITKNVNGAMVYIDPLPKTMNGTALIAKQYTQNVPVICGMPDTYIEDEQVYHKLATALEDGADVAVALFIARIAQHHGGMCRTAGNQVAEVIDKPGERIPSAPYIWGALAWQAVFWGYIKAIDPHVGYALPPAIKAGLDVRAVICDGNYYDCGTPAEYFECIREVTVYA